MIRQKYFIANILKIKIKVKKFAINLINLQIYIMYSFVYNQPMYRKNLRNKYTGYSIIKSII